MKGKKNLLSLPDGNEILDQVLQPLHTLYLTVKRCDCCAHAQKAQRGLPLPEKGEECTQTLSITPHSLGVNPVAPRA